MLIKRTMDSGANDLQTIYRPCTVKEVIGNDVNKNMIGSCLHNGTLSHSLLFTGPAGCGKTTMARIISLGLNCKETEISTDEPCLECEICKSTLNQKNLDVVEINVGKDSGKAAVTQIVKDLSFAPMFCKYKVLIFDEAHELSKSAQDLLLKVIEDGYSHVYFIFCTNLPEKLRPAFLSRVTTMNFSRLPDDELLETLKNICDFEGASYKEDVLSYIVEASKGVPRDAIKYLKQVIDEQSWELSNIKLMLSNYLLDEEDPNIMEIGKALEAGSFKGALGILEKLKNVPEEGIRIALAGFFTVRLKRSKTFEAGHKYSSILDIITEPIYMTGKPAHHVLVNYLFKTVSIIKGK